MANFNIKNSPIISDPLRNYLFEVDFVELPTKITAELNELTIRATSCIIPARGNGVLEVPYYQMKSAYPGKPTFGDNKFSVTFNEFEDRKISTFLYSWQELIFDSKDTGASKATNKLDLVCPTVKVKLLDNKMKSIKSDRNGIVDFKNVWIENVSEVSLNWNEESAVQITAEFHFDMWNYQ